ncbi:MAG: glycosyltransferase family 2 protein [Porphyromonadaceae bacterium]|nr:glycosyltransferase family 2 protein [Porphyromonadaceae bacterium]
MVIQKRVAVVVLNWNGRKLLEQFMPSWLSFTPEEAELIIVDNGSSDGSVAYLQSNHPDVRCIAFKQNYGFALGYNRAIEMLEHPIVVLLNSDVALTASWLEQPLSLLDQFPKIAAVQPKIRAYRDPDMFEYAGAAGGYLDVYGYPFCRGRIFDTLEVDQGQYDVVATDLLWASGACLIIRREVYLEVGGLDARFFAHQEEIDLCWRVAARGGKIALAPKSVVYHVGGASLGAEHPHKTYLNFRNNLLMLYKNLPEARLGAVLRVRILLDCLALFVFLLRGQAQHARAVWQAYRDYRRMRTDFEPDRCENLAQTTVPHPEGIKSFSLLRRYYLCGQKHYSQL